MSGALSHEMLKAKHRRVRENSPDDVRLRVHRALSWVNRAEMAADDADARFLFLWIAFNAAYAGERDQSFGEKDVFRNYFVQLVALDAEQRIYDVIWERFPGPIRLLMRNKYVFAEFWRHHNGLPGYEDWEKRFGNSTRAFARALKSRNARNTVKILKLVFDRLYELRNQLIHGGSTWNGEVNRDQVRDGAAIMESLVPVFIDVMMEHPSEDWGRPVYPVVEWE